jgi:hypothetical protein
MSYVFAQTYDVVCLYDIVYFYYIVKNLRYRRCKYDVVRMTYDIVRLIMRSVPAAKTPLPPVSQYIVYDVVNDVVYDILRYDVVYDIVYDTSRYDVVYDISRYDVVYDIVCDVIYEIVYFSIPLFGGVALPDPGRPDVRGVLLPPQLVLPPCFGKDTIHQSCQDPCVDICREGIELCRTWSRLPPVVSDIAYDIVYDILTYDIVNDIVYDIVYGIEYNRINIL